MKKPAKKKFSTKRRIRGLFGPKKKTLEAVKAGLESKKRSREPDWKTIGRMSTKYTLDLMNITDPKKKKENSKNSDELEQST